MLSLNKVVLGDGREVKSPIHVNSKYIVSLEPFLEDALPSTRSKLIVNAGGSTCQWYLVESIAMILGMLE